MAHSQDARSSRINIHNETASSDRLSNSQGFTLVNSVTYRSAYPAMLATTASRGMRCTRPTIMGPTITFPAADLRNTTGAPPANVRPHPAGMAGARVALYDKTAIAPSLCGDRLALIDLHHHCRTIRYSSVGRRNLSPLVPATCQDTWAPPVAFLRRTKATPGKSIGRLRDADASDTCSAGSDRGAPTGGPRYRHEM